jgi:hypothetical protein
MKLKIYTFVAIVVFYLFRITLAQADQYAEFMNCSNALFNLGAKDPTASIPPISFEKGAKNNGIEVYPIEPKNGAGPGLVFKVGDQYYFKHLPIKKADNEVAEFRIAVPDNSQYRQKFSYIKYDFKDNKVLSIDNEPDPFKDEAHLTRVHHPSFYINKSYAKIDCKWHAPENAMIEGKDLKPEDVEQSSYYKECMSPVSQSGYLEPLGADFISSAQSKNWANSLTRKPLV